MVPEAEARSIPFKTKQVQLFKLVLQVLRGFASTRVIEVTGKLAMITLPIIASSYYAPGVSHTADATRLLRISNLVSKLRIKINSKVLSSDSLNFELFDAKKS